MTYIALNGQIVQLRGVGGRSPACHYSTSPPHSQVTLFSAHPRQSLNYWFQCFILIAAALSTEMLLLSLPQHAHDKLEPVTSVFHRHTTQSRITRLIHGWGFFCRTVSDCQRQRVTHAKLIVLQWHAFCPSIYYKSLRGVLLIHWLRGRLQLVVVTPTAECVSVCWAWAWAGMGVWWGDDHHG